MGHFRTPEYPVPAADSDWDLCKVDRPRVTRSPDGRVVIYQDGAYYYFMELGSLAGQIYTLLSI